LLVPEEEEEEGWCSTFELEGEERRSWVDSIDPGSVELPLLLGSRWRRKREEVRWLDGERGLGCSLEVGMRKRKRVGKEEDRWRVDGTNPSHLLLLLRPGAAVDLGRGVVGERERFDDDPTRMLRVERGTAVEVEVEGNDLKDLMELMDEREVDAAAVRGAAVAVGDGVEGDL